MKKILVMPDGNWLSHTSRPFEIAKILRQIGHEVIFACEGNYTKLPEKNGFRVLSIKTIDLDRVLAIQDREVGRKRLELLLDVSERRGVPGQVRILGDQVLEDFHGIRADARLERRG